MKKRNKSFGTILCTCGLAIKRRQGNEMVYIADQVECIQNYKLILFLKGK